MVVARFAELARPPATASSSRRSSRTRRSSAAASARAATSCARRCTSSRTRDGRLLALRPEGTASVVRAFVQHHPPVPWKAWYATPAFRYERPQAGRYRQHHQLGVEALGSADPDLDVEVIACGAAFLASLGLRGVELKLNSMGDDACLPAYRLALAVYLAAPRGRALRRARPPLDDEPAARARLQGPGLRGAARGGPRLVGPPVRAVPRPSSRGCRGPRRAGHRAGRPTTASCGGSTTTPARPSSSPRRRFDAAQNVVCGGGRYDELVAALGGKDDAGDRLRVRHRARAPRLRRRGRPRRGRPTRVDVFVVDIVDGAAARDLTASCGPRGIAADRAFDGRSLKAQLKPRRPRPGPARRHRRGRRARPRAR